MPHWRGLLAVNRRPARWSWLAPVALCAALAAPCLAQEALRGAVLPPAADTLVDENDAVMAFVFWVSTIVFIPMMAVMVYWMFKYRRRPGVPQQRSAHHNLALELTWSIIPLILYGVMFYWGFKVYVKMHVTPGGSELITVTAKKWNWTWQYDNGGGSLETTVLADKESPVYVVPQGRPVKLLMHSEDVIHSLYIPAFRKKIDVMPNRYTTYWFDATKPGDYHLYCAEYCGDQHSQMMALVKVRPDAEYQEWKAKLNATEGIPIAELGAKLYITKGCVACHSTNGTAGTGPSWKDIWGKAEKTDKGDVIVDENYVRESILNPGAKITQGFSNQMPTFQGQLKDRELTALVVYIMTLSEAGKAEAEQKIKQDDEERKSREGQTPAAPAAAAPAAPAQVASK